MTVRRRYEILLPAEFNDGRLVAEACPLCFPDSLAEVSDTFGAFTFRPQVALGRWTADGMRYDDELFVLTLDVEDTPEHRGVERAFQVASDRAVRAVGDPRVQLSDRPALTVAFPGSCRARIGSPKGHGMAVMLG